MRSPGCSCSERRTGGGGSKTARRSRGRRRRRESSGARSPKGAAPFARRAALRPTAERRRVLANGGFGEPGGASDLEAWEPAATQRQHAGAAERVEGFGGTLGARTAVEQTAGALGAETCEPLVGGAPRDAESRSDVRHGLLENDAAADHLGSTQGREFGLTVKVHAALVFGLVLLSQPHLSKSSPHEQPIGTSQLGPSAASAVEVESRLILGRRQSSNDG